MVDFICGLIAEDNRAAIAPLRDAVVVKAKRKGVLSPKQRMELDERISLLNELVPKGTSVQELKREENEEGAASFRNRVSTTSLNSKGTASRETPQQSTGGEPASSSSTCALL